MPDDCRRTESNDPTGLLNPPAKIDVVTGFMVLGIETADAFKSPSIKGHVTAWNMLCDCIGKQDMAGATGRCRDAGLNPILRWWRHVRSAHARIIAAYQRTDQVIEPIDIGHAVGIGVSQHFAPRSCSACVASVAQSMIALMDVAHLRELRGSVSCVVSRAVVDQDHFVVGIGEFAQRIETSCKSSAAVV